MRFVKDDDVGGQCSDFIARVLRLREFVVRVDEDLPLGSPPLFELALPIDLGNRRAHHDDFLQAEHIARGDDLDCFA